VGGRGVNWLLEIDKGENILCSKKVIIANSFNVGHNLACIK
jgi:hypothetical protein